MIGLQAAVSQQLSRTAALEDVGLDWRDEQRRMAEESQFTAQQQALMQQEIGDGSRGSADPWLFVEPLKLDQTPVFRINPGVPSVVSIWNASGEQLAEITNDGRLVLTENVPTVDTIRCGGGASEREAEMEVMQQRMTALEALAGERTEALKALELTRSQLATMAARVAILESLLVSRQREQTKPRDNDRPILTGMPPYGPSKLAEATMIYRRHQHELSDTVARLGLLGVNQS